MDDVRAWVEHSTIRKGRFDVMVGTQSSASGITLTPEQAHAVYADLGALLAVAPEPEGSGVVTACTHESTSRGLFKLWCLDCGADLGPLSDGSGS